MHKLSEPSCSTRVRRAACAVLAAALATALLGWAGAAEPAPDPVASHHIKLDADSLHRSTARVPLAHVPLVREDGVRVNLDELLGADRPVYVDFVYTTCTAVCPVMSATFAALQEKLGKSRDAVDLVSISIDPEEDTPRRLREFRKKYDASPSWHFYTGSVEASAAAQRAFGVYKGDKMLHTPVTLFRAAPDQPWVRLDGFATPQELYRELPPGRLAAR